MKLILEIDVDDCTCEAFEQMSNEKKESFKQTTAKLLQKVTGQERSARIKQLLDEIRSESGAAERFNPEILYTLLRGNGEF
jgi:uncharacterized protein YaiL (DUF2058 family)